MEHLEKCGKCIISIKRQIEEKTQLVSNGFGQSNLTIMVASINTRRAWL
jgi:hypothetical protein